MKKIAKEAEQIARIMAGLNCSEAEAKEIYKADCEIDHGEPQDFDLTAEQIKVAQKYTRTGTRKMKETGLNLKPRERKPNEAKALIIETLARFLSENAEFSAENLQITNKERQIAFTYGDNAYELTLVQKRKPK